MKHPLGILAVVLTLTLGTGALAHAGAFHLAPAYQKNINNAVCCEQRKDTERARQYWAKVAEYGDELLAGGATLPGYYMGTARAHYALGDFAKAASLYEALLERGREQGIPDLALAYPWAYVYLGLAYAELGDTAKTVAAWKQVPMAIGPLYGVIRAELVKLENGAQ